MVLTHPPLNQSIPVPLTSLPIHLPILSPLKLFYASSFSPSLTSDLVSQGKIRYIGASSMHTYQFLGMQHVAEKNGWTKFISMQNYYNLIYREEEREMLPACKELGVGYRFPL